MVKTRNIKENKDTRTTNSFIYKTKRKLRFWAPQEIIQLKKLVSQFNKNWTEIVKRLPGRTILQCKLKWCRLNPNLHRHKWNKEEDKKLLALVQKYGQKWKIIGEEMGGLKGKQIRDRFINHANLEINKKPWSSEEDRIIIQMYKIKGSKWSTISNYLEGRPENMVKNRFYSHLKYLSVEELEDHEKGNLNPKSTPELSSQSMRQGISKTKPQLKLDLKINKNATENSIESTNTSNQDFSSNIKTKSQILIESNDQNPLISKQSNQIGTQKEVPENLVELFNHEQILNINQNFQNVAPVQDSQRNFSEFNPMAYHLQIQNLYYQQYYYNQMLNHYLMNLPMKRAN